MKKITLLTLLIVGILFSACKKEECNCQKFLGSFYFGIRTSHYPINSTDTPRYRTLDNTTDLPLYLSHRGQIDDPPKSLGLDYYQYETDDTEFRNSDFGLSFYSVAGSTLTEVRNKLIIDWYGVKDINTIYQKYTMDFTFPVDSNIFSSELFIYDSLFVVDKWYKKVLTGPVYINHQTGLEYTGAIPERFYYSTDYGIVKFDMSNGTHWEIINEE